MTLQPSMTAIVALALLASPVPLRAALGDNMRASSPGVPDNTPPWAFTNEQRIARRFDQALAAERVAKYMRSQSLEGQFEAGVTEVVNGADTPELFMPWEVFDMFMGRVFREDPGARAQFRSYYENRGLALPEGFWDRLEKRTQNYVALRFRIADVLRRLPAANEAGKRALLVELDALNDHLCAERTDSLNAARIEFGAFFDRFLYTEVAPGMKSFSTATNRISDERHLQIERGCK